VIDDVWQETHLRPFLQGGPNCTRLVTTRQHEIAIELDVRVPVGEMTGDESAAMLTARLDAPLPNRAPLRALAHLNTALDRHGVEAFNRRNPQERNAAIGHSLGVSLELLAEEERARYTELAIFPDDVEIPLRAVAALWGLDDFDTEALVARLADLSLLYLDLPHRSVRLHDVVRAWLAEQLADPAARHARLLQAWGGAPSPPLMTRR